VATKTSASSGTVDFTCIDGNAVVGTFDIMFGSDHVTGSFDAPLCGSTLSTSCGH
jgi:hypothetical protein